MPLLAFPPVSEWLEARWGRDVGKLLPGSSQENAEQARSGSDFDQNLSLHADAIPSPEAETAPSRVFSEQSPIDETFREPPERTEAAKVTLEDVRLQAIRRRLVGLDAKEMTLDLVNDVPTSYRFSCQIPLGGGAVYRKLFAATDAEPLVAAGRVLADVESWLGPAQAGLLKKSS